MPARHLTRAKVAAATVAVALVGGGVAAAVTIGASDDRHRPKDHAAVNRVQGPKADFRIGNVAATGDPATFAASVALTLFAWDTTAPVPLSEYTGRLLAVADPSGEESAGLVTDLTTYLPSPESWEDLKTYETRQWIDIQSYEVPDEWKRADFNGETADLAVGTTAYTVTGLRRRSGIWQGKPAQTVDEVSFTIFMTCRPTYETCRLLRLSQLNKPLR